MNTIQLAKVTPIKPVYMTTLVQSEGKLMQKSGDTLRSGGFGYVAGFHGGASVVMNMLVAMSQLLRERVAEKLQMPDRKSFTNGGNYGSGYPVQETVLYRPYAQQPWRDQPAYVNDTQLLFTFCPELHGINDHKVHSHPTIKIDGVDRQVMGVSITQNDAKVRMFTRIFKAIELREVYNTDVWYTNLFPEFKDCDHLSIYSFDADDVDNMIEIAATLIAKEYYGGLTYGECLAVEQAKVDRYNAKQTPVLDV